MAEWLQQYRFRQKLTISASEIDATLTDFPLLILTDKVNSSTDKKLALTTANGKRQCYVEIEKSTLKGAILWAKIPSISHTADTILFLYYDPLAPDNDGYVGDVGSTPAQNVWDSNYKLVCHMVDDPDTSHVKDSTSNGNDGTKTGANEPIEADGKIGKAQDFDGADDIVDCGNNPSLDNIFDGGGTISLWIDAGSDGENDAGTMLYKIQGWYLNVIGEVAGKVKVRLYYQFTVGNGFWQTTSTEVTIGALTHITVLYDSDNVANDPTLYINGASVTLSEVATPNGVRESDAGVTLYVGNDDATTATFDGKIDEVQLSAVPRSVAWVGASYKTQNNTLIGYGDIENKEASGPKPQQAPRPPINIGLFYRLKDWLAQKVAE